MKTANKDKETVVDKSLPEKRNEDSTENETFSPGVSMEFESCEKPSEELKPSKSLEVIEPVEDDSATFINEPVVGSADESNKSNTSSITSFEKNASEIEKSDIDSINLKKEDEDVDKKISLLKFRNGLLNDLKNSFISKIEDEKAEITLLKHQLGVKPFNLVPLCNTSSVKLDEIMDLLHRENQILEIKKISLVRQTMEQLEACIDLKTKIESF